MSPLTWHPLLKKREYDMKAGEKLFWIGVGFMALIAASYSAKGAEIDLLVTGQHDAWVIGTDKGPVLCLAHPSVTYYSGSGTRTMVCQDLNIPGFMKSGVVCIAKIQSDGTSRLNCSVTGV